MFSTACIKNWGDHSSGRPMLVSSDCHYWKQLSLKRPDNNKKLVFSLNRGGLWWINKPAQNLLARAEFHFRKGNESVSRNQKRERSIILKKCLSDIDIMSNYQTIIDSAELAVDKSVSCHHRVIYFRSIVFICKWLYSKIKRKM